MGGGGLYKFVYYFGGSWYQKVLEPLNQELD
jgi:hypothetical protein